MIGKSRAEGGDHDSQGNDEVQTLDRSSMSSSAIRFGEPNTEEQCNVANVEDDKLQKILQEEYRLMQ